MGFLQRKKIFLGWGCCSVGRVLAWHTEENPRFDPWALHKWYFDPRTKEVESGQSSKSVRDTKDPALKQEDFLYAISSLIYTVYLLCFLFLLLNIQSHCACQSQDSSQIHGSFASAFPLAHTASTTTLYPTVSDGR